MAIHDFITSAYFLFFNVLRQKNIKHFASIPNMQDNV